VMLVWVVIGLHFGRNTICVINPSDTPVGYNGVLKCLLLLFFVFWAYIYILVSLFHPTMYFLPSFIVFVSGLYHMTIIT